MNYEEFVSEMRMQLYQRIPQEIALEVETVVKNNSVRLDSLLLIDPQKNCSPSFYLQEYYEKYCDGISVESLAQEIYEKWMDFTEFSRVRLPDMTFSHCREGIIYRLVNYTQNETLLQNIPHIPFFDLAIIFYYLVGSSDEGVQSIRISNAMMEMWEIDTKELYQLAAENTPRLFPVKFGSMREILQEMYCFSMPAEDDASQEHALYILTNTKAVNGAAVWLYPDMLETVARRCGGDFYILPSSIHELLILTDSGDLEHETLLQIVGHVNGQCVQPEDYLSDHVYYYHRKLGKIKVLSPGALQKKENCVR